MSDRKSVTPAVDPAAVAVASELAPGWLPYPADVNELTSGMWAHDVVRDAAGQLTVAGVTVADLHQEFGTPLFVISEADFRRRARDFKDSFDAAFADICGGVDVYYAGKAFLSIEIARWVDSEGLRLDTCSGGELAVAARAGLAGEKLGLHGNNKSDAEINRALQMHLGRIVVDSLAELERVGSIARQRGETANVLLRLTPGVHAHTHEFIATAHEDQKFGLSMTADFPASQVPSTGPNPGNGLSADAPHSGGISAAEQAVAMAAADPGIELLGLHCHIGSQIFEPEGFELAAQRLLTFLAQMRSKYSLGLPELDLGGGYGIAYTAADTPRPAAQIARAMAAVVRSTCAELGITAPRISIEPGRAIVGSTTFTLYKTGTLKTVNVELPAAGSPDAGSHELESHAARPQDAAQVTRPRRYVSVDGGMSDNARPVLYDADYSAILAGRSSTAVPMLSRVVGKHCESGDIVVRDVYLPDDVAAGDLLAVPGTGAYCWALASNYNYVPRPPVVAVREGSARLIVRGETEDDLLARDLGTE
ncbi:diaminopimelate decarboxylase family protein [Arthrobacter sp. H14-L1]|uniref:diaminopimelate decarboxylase family protein n=1 Tax=Arthrobacter sp. H14-L1 TaxID=2996697 RepID=UPI0022707BC3|nr:diaminopimelate decarboxylase [Arthrobacter sp. H14-L1]MCY0905329.1 diaminopimelate decarboxylase [Arthrobacter sp. H14-L1]